MNYISTRGRIEPLEAAYAAAGIFAEDGGLFVPERMPRKLDDGDINCLAYLSHGRRFAYLSGRFMQEMYIGFVSMFGDKAFAREDFGGNIIAVSLRDGRCFLDASFCELALRPLPLLYEYNLAAAGKGKPYTLGYDVKPDPERKPLIVVPSEGEEALVLIKAVKSLTNGKIAVFHPSSCLLDNQDDDVLICGVNAGINEISHAITKFMLSGDAAKNGLYPMRADVSNWFGIMSHVTCFVSAYCEMILKGYIKAGEWINLELPYEESLETVTAAFYAKEMGLKIGKIICPAPKDSVLERLIRSGELDAACIKEGIFFPLALERLIYAAKGSVSGLKLEADARQKLNDAFLLGEADEKMRLVIQKKEILSSGNTAGREIELDDIADELSKFMGGESK